MGFDIESLGLSTAPKIVAAIAAGGGLVVIIVIVLCICWCCRRKYRENRKESNNNVSAENPPGGATGNNQHVVPAQHRHQQQNNNPPRMAEHHKAPNHFPPPLQPPLRSPNHFPPPPESPLNHPPKRSHAHKPSQSSTESTGSNSLPPPQQSKRSPTPQYSPAYKPSPGKSSVSGSEISSVPPSSPTLSYASSQTMFTYNDLAMATNGFSKANLLGQGGFGLVHKGLLPNGKEIAVKSLRSNSEQGDREFESEVEIISRVHHRHLVSLVGYCSTGSHRLLVYEFVPNKTLEFHLHDEEQPTMDWATRMKVAIGSAKGLAYLHEDCQPRIIHRDIKAANILLDNKFQAKVADFGLAKITPEESTHVTTRIMGSLGYLAPEYASSGRLTEKSDVYSFGVMLLELITGRKPVDRKQKEYNIVEWSRSLLTTALEDENFNMLVDPRLQFSYKHSEMARMVACAATCVRKSARRRPQMSQVVRALEGNLTINELNEGITPGLSFVERDDIASEHSGSQYSGSQFSGSQYRGDLYSVDFDSKNMGPSTTSEYGGTTSEYGLYASSSSSEERTTQESGSEQVHRHRRHFKQQRFLDSSG